MNHVATRTSLAITLALIAGAALTPAAGAAESKPGDRWKIRTEMQATGFSLPPTTIEVCTPRDEPEATGLPEPGRDGCEMYDIKQSGKTRSWKIRCEGNPPTEGGGEITNESDDRYHGTMWFRSGSDEVRTKIAGERLAGACDAGELERKAAAMEARAAQWQEKMRQVEGGSNESAQAEREAAREAASAAPTSDSASQPAADEANEPQPESAAEQAIDAGKRALKSIFGR